MSVFYGGLGKKKKLNKKKKPTWINKTFLT